MRGCFLYFSVQPHFAQPPVCAVPASHVAQNPFIPTIYLQSVYFATVRANDTVPDGIRNYNLPSEGNYLSSNYVMPSLVTLGLVRFLKDFFSSCQAAGKQLS